MRFLGNIFLILLVFFSAVFLGQQVFAEDPTPTPSSSGSVCSSVPECSEQKLDCGKCVEFLTNKKDEASSKAKTLSSEIGVMDKQIKLTEARISATEQLINELEEDIEIAKGKISDLEEDIETSTKALIGRITGVYQVGSVQPWQIFLTSNNINDVFKRLTYLKIVQIYDKRKVYAAEQAKNDYNNQKEIFEDKEAEAEAQSAKLTKYTEQLEEEKSGKQQLLTVTRNDESRYQKLLAEARAERAVVLGGGKEVFLRTVSEGDSIGTIISGASGCSSGTHLHFSMYQGTSVRDPNDYLSPKSFSYSYSDSQYGYYGTINPHGSYSWPINDPITINQGYGTHGFAQQFYPSGLHDGIDMEGGSLNVKAVRSGKLYEGSYKCSNGTLTYAKVEHDDGLISWYLHIYPN
jgi:peptidoglycan hydrolase CwlO-like protein